MAQKKQNDLSRSEQKLAYLLLIPSLIVLVVIALYPLGKVFVDSTTDKRMASTEEAKFVGLKNYADLLSFTIRELPPVMNDSGEQMIDEKSGEPVFMKPYQVLPDEPRFYKELTTYRWFGKKYVIGATEAPFLLAVGDTITFTVMSVVLETLLGLMVALILNAKFRGRGAMRVAMLVPWAVPTAVSSRMWEWMFTSSRAGFFNMFFERLGLSNGQFSFTTEAASQLWVMIAIDVWKTTPFMALLLLAGLQMIPASMYEAAYVDGAGKVRQFFSLTLPMLRPTIAVALTFRTLDALRVFDLFQIVFANKRYSMASFAYYELIENKAMGYSAAASVLIFLLIMIFIMVYIKLVGGVDDEV